MTLQIAKARRLEALNKRNKDRILVEPVAHYTQITLPDEGTVAGYLIDALRHGADLAQLSAETGWSKSTLLVNLYKVAKKTGVGIRRRQDTLQLMLPSGSKHTFPGPKVVNPSTTLSAQAEEVLDTPSLVA